jgi:hypothetical protein
MVPRKQAGHMTCTRPQAARQILLATRASSTHDPKRTSAAFSLALVAGRRDPKFYDFGPSSKVQRQRVSISAVSAFNCHPVLELLAALA